MKTLDKVLDWTLIIMYVVFTIISFIKGDFLVGVLWLTNLFWFCSVLAHRGIIRDLKNEYSEDHKAHHDIMDDMQDTMVKMAKAIKQIESTYPGLIEFKEDEIVVNPSWKPTKTKTEK